MRNQRNFQGGWVAQFVVIGIVLVLLFAGGVFWLKSMNKDETSKPASTDSSKSDDENASNLGDDSAKTDTDSSDKSEDSKNDDRKSSDDSSKTEENSSDNSAKSDSSDNSASTKKSDKKSSDLPTTGPREDFLSFVAILAVVFAGVSFARSRHLLTSRGR